MDLIPSSDLLQMQEAERRRENARVLRSSVWGLSWETAVEDARDAVTGIVGDLYGTTKSERRSLRSVLGESDRLRGLGIVLIVLALAGCAVQGLLAE